MRRSRRRARASARSKLGQWLKFTARRSEFIRLPLYLLNLQLALYVIMGIHDENGERSARRFCDKGSFFRLTLLSRGGVDFLIHTLPWRAESCYHNGEDVVCYLLIYVLIMCRHLHVYSVGMQCSTMPRIVTAVGCYAHLATAACSCTTFTRALLSEW